MKARELLGSEVTPEGTALTLHAEGGGYVVRIGNEVLMSSRSHGSEQGMAVASLGPALHADRPRVLVGGLGMGFTLRAVLDVLPPRSEVVVAELFAAVVEWNRGPLAALSADALSDRRVRVEIADVRRVLDAPGRGFDSILLDVDNGPEALTTLANAAIYRPSGLAAIRSALAPGGLVAVWSASPSRTFEKALSRAGFRVEVVSLASRHDSHRGGRHTLFLGLTAESAGRRRPSFPRHGEGRPRNSRR